MLVHAQAVAHIEPQPAEALRRRERGLQVPFRLELAGDPGAAEAELARGAHRAGQGAIEPRIERGERAGETPS